jgi:TRAP-type transport system periplasmic protein
MKQDCSSGLFLLLAVLFLFTLSVPLRAQEIKLRFSDQFPPAHKNAQLAQEWCKEVEKRTNGRVKITYYPTNALVPITKTYEAVVTGTVDIGTALMAYSPGRLPLTEVLTLPLGFSNGYQATKLANAYYARFKPKEFDETHVLYLHASGPHIIQTKKVVGSLDDVKGMRIKANAETAGIVKAIGAAPVTIPMTETYESLQRGLIDGLLAAIEPLKGWKLSDLIKTCIQNYGISPTMSNYVAINKAKWNSLPKDVQGIIEKLDEEWIEKQGELWSDLDLEAEAYAKEKGIKIVKASKEETAKFAERMKPIMDEYVKTMKGKGLPGDEALKFALDYIKTHP